MIYRMLQALLAAALFGASAPLAKLLLGKIPPVMLAALLYLGSGVGLLLFRTLSRTLAQAQAGVEVEVEAPLRREDLPWLAGAILAGGVAAPIVLLYGLRTTPAATASLLLNFEGVATTVLAALAFREAVGQKVWLAVAAITAASVVLSWTGGAEWGFSAGALGILAACALWGLDNNLTRQISAKDPLTITTLKGLTAGTCSLLLALALGQSLPDAASVAAALLLGALSYGASIVLFILALRHLGAARTSAFFGTAPFAGALLSLAFFRQPVTFAFAAAVLLMIAGAVLLLGEDHAHPHRHAAVHHDHAHRHDDGHHAHAHPDGDPPSGVTHAHPHDHEGVEHSHPHAPDLHHRHGH